MCRWWFTYSPEVNSLLLCINYCVCRWWFTYSAEVNSLLLTFKNLKLNFTYAGLPDKEFKWYLLNIFILFGVIYAVQAIMLYK